MKFKTALIAVAMLTAPAAMAADSMMSDIGNAAKDAAVQTGKDKAQQKMDSTSMGVSGGGMNMGSTASSASSQQVPTAQSVKDAAKDKAKAKASDAVGSAMDKALNKY